MSDETMGDEVYQPDETHPEDREDVDLDNALEEGRQDETLDTGYSPPEKPLAVNDYGTTAAGQHDGEPLEMRLREEVPDVGVPDGDGIGDARDLAGEPLEEDLAGERRAGRLVRGGNVVGEDVGIDGGAASAEEAAVHIARESELEEAGEAEPGEDFGDDARGGGGGQRAA